MKATGRVAFETPAGVWALFTVEDRDYPTIKIAVKRPAYGCLRCFRLSDQCWCQECGGLCDKISEEPNSVLPKEM